jgi:hypothetical protein
VKGHELGHFVHEALNGFGWENPAPATLLQPPGSFKQELKHTSAVIFPAQCDRKFVNL